VEEYRMSDLFGTLESRYIDLLKPRSDYHRKIYSTSSSTGAIVVFISAYDIVLLL
jgi:hypothetical protein